MPFHLRSKIPNEPNPKRRAKTSTANAIKHGSIQTIRTGEAVQPAWSFWGSIKGCKFVARMRIVFYARIALHSKQNHPTWRQGIRLANDMENSANGSFAPEAASRKSNNNNVCFSLRSEHRPRD